MAQLTVARKSSTNRR